MAFSTYNSFHNLYKSNYFKISAPTINAISYPTNNSATIFFTPPSKTTGITDYKYSFDNITYTSIGIPTNSFTIAGLTGFNNLFFYAVKNSALSTSANFVLNPSYISKATGGGKLLITSIYEYYVFTNTDTSSNLIFNNPSNIEYLLIAAGGNGGSTSGGGGGAGGVLSNAVSDISSINITVGKPSSISNTGPGGDSIIKLNSTTTITAKGGGLGGANKIGGSGGSGGGGSAWVTNLSGDGIPGQGYNGGRGYIASYGNGGSGGGGGAGGVGGNSIFKTTYGIGGVGGAGTTAYSDWIITISRYMNTVADISWSIYTISGDIGYIASGGAGGAGSESNAYGGFTLRTIGGGGNGATAYATGLGVNNIKGPSIGIPNTGGGSGGCGGNGSIIFPPPVQGGSGLVIIRTTINTLLNTAFIYLPLTNNFNNYGTNKVSSTVVGEPIISTQSNKTCTYFNNATTNYTDNQNPQNGIYITLPYLTDNSTDFTIGAWVYASVGYYNPFAIFNETTTITNIDIGFQTTNLVQFYTQDNNSSLVQIGSSNSYNFTSSWLHIALVRSQNGDNCICYLNGVNVTSNIITPTSNIPSNILIGGDLNGGFNGYLRHFTAFNYALTPTQITELYNTTS